MSTTTENQSSTARVLGGLVTYLQVDGALKAAEFYHRAFGAETVFSYPADEKGRTMHVHLHINGSSLMLSDPFPDHGHPHEKAQAFSPQLIVDDIDAWWTRATGAGVDIVMPIELMFWGDRYGQLRDPFGILWAMNQPAKTV